MTRIVDCFKQTGEARVPKQGQGKRDDPRWVFSGPRGPANLHRLEEAVGKSKVDDLISDVRLNYLDAGLGLVRYLSASEIAPGFP